VGSGTRPTQKQFLKKKKKKEMYCNAFLGFRLQEAEQGGRAEAEAATERQPPPAVQEGEAGHPKEQEDTPLHQVGIPK
jgi:hypothetical protein